MLYSKHGGHVMAEDAEGAGDVAKKGNVILTRGPLPSATPFDYLLLHAPRAFGGGVPLRPQHGA